jgi:NADPH2:quinone reductase
MHVAKIVRFHQFGGPEVLRLDEIEVGAPGVGEVRIRVGAFGLNRVEALFRSGAFVQPAFPSRIGYEAAGVIDQVGPEVTGWSVGDRVAVLYGLSMEQYGTYGEVLCYPADMLVPILDGVSLAEAAASWMQYGTAFALVDIASIGPGDAVVITAASSSVGLAAIQIANAAGAVPIAVTRGRGKAEALSALGAAHVIVSDEEDVGARILAITGGTGAKVVFDAVAGPPLLTLLGATAPGGLAIVYGMLAGYDMAPVLPSLMQANLTLRGFAADLLVKQPASRARLVAYITEGLANGSLKPVIDRTFDLAEIVDAHRYLESNVQLGKIVVTTATADA